MCHRCEECGGLELDPLCSGQDGIPRLQEAPGDGVGDGQATSPRARGPHQPLLRSLGGGLGRTQTLWVSVAPLVEGE